MTTNALAAEVRQARRILESRIYDLECLCAALVRRGDALQTLVEQKR